VWQGRRPAAGNYLYRTLAEHLPDVAVFFFRDVRFKLATGAGLRKSGLAHRGDHPPHRSRACSRPSALSCSASPTGLPWLVSEAPSRWSARAASLTTSRR
jgi:hypothetical protein